MGSFYNIREKQNEDYLASHHSVDPDNVDILELLPHISVIEGDSLHYTDMVQYIENHDMSDPVNYEYIKTQMDMDNFINYNVAQIYMANNNWLAHNIKLWRPSTSDGKWRWIFCDLDWGMMYKDKNMFAILSNLNYQYEPMYFKLLENDTIKYTLINRFADYMNTIFEPDRVLEQLYEVKEQLEPEMPDHIARWKDFEIAIGLIESMDEWHDNVAELELFFKRRPAIMRTQIIEEFGLSGTAQVTLAVSSAEAGTIEINSIVPDEYPWSGTYFKDVPITVTALPNLGYEFIGWTGAELEDSLSATITLTDNISVTAMFEKSGSNSYVFHQSQSPYRIAGVQSIGADASLTIEPGVELLMSPNSNIFVSGELQMNGTTDNPIVITPEEGQNWQGIFLNHASGSSSISNVIINGASTLENPAEYPAAISSLESDVVIDNVRFENNRQSIFANGGSVTVRNCFFAETNTNEPINLKNAEALVENCRFENIFFGDAIDYDGIHDGVIRNNEIYGTIDSDGDGIDIGDDCVNVLITGNRIYDCTDKGISVGEGSKDIRAERNIIAGCLYGIAVKDSATAFIDHNTLFDNDYAVAAYEKGAGRFGGGTAVVTNSILMKSNTSTFFTDALSDITVSYSLCDSEVLPGEHNIMADPLLVSPENGIYDLLPGSPAIYMDSSGAELGALLYKEIVSNIVITEINYNSSEDFDPGDWIELYNIDDEPVDISGWVFRDEDDAHQFVLPENTILSPHAYMVLYGDEALFTAVFPDVHNGIGSFGFGLSADGEVLRLYNAEGGIVDWLKYNDASPWPVSPDGRGATLSLIDPEQDNTAAENWARSAEHGTPGEANVVITGIDENAQIDVPIAFSLGQNYPNPFNPSTTIPFSLPESGRVTIEIYSVLGQRVAKLIDEDMAAGYHRIVFDAEHLANGVYFYRIRGKRIYQNKIDDAVEVILLSPIKDIHIA